MNEKYISIEENQNFWIQRITITFQTPSTNWFKKIAVQQVNSQ